MLADPKIASLRQSKHKFLYSNQLESASRDGIAVTYARYRVLLENAGKRDSMVGFAIELFVKEDGRWINPSWHLHGVRD